MYVDPTFSDLAKFFINPRVCRIFWLFYKHNHVAVNNNSFTTYFPILKTFFSYLVVLAILYWMILNRNSDTEHPCFIPDHRGKAFPISPLSCLLQNFCKFSIVLRKFIFISSLLSVWGFSLKNKYVDVELG